MSATQSVEVGTDAKPSPTDVSRLLEEHTEDFQGALTDALEAFSQYEGCEPTNTTEIIILIKDAEGGGVGASSAFSVDLEEFLIED